MKAFALVLLLVAGHSFGNGFVENGQFKYDFNNDYLNQNIKHGGAMSRNQFNNPNQTVIQPQYRQYHQPAYKPQQYDYRKKVSPTCWGPYCTKR